MANESVSCGTGERFLEEQPVRPIHHLYFDKTLILPALYLMRA